MLKQTKKMKFDVIVGNPPFNNDENNSLFISFTKLGLRLNPQFLAYIVPSDWCSGIKNKSFMEFMIKQRISFIKHLNTNDYFQIRRLTCYFVIDRNNKDTKTRIYDSKRNTDLIDLTDSEYIPIFDVKSNDLSVKISKFNTNNLSNRYLHGNLYLNKRISSDSGLKFITGVGRTKDPLGIDTISWEQINSVVGLGMSKIVIQHSTSPKKLGAIKICDDNDVGGFSVIFLTGSKTEIPNMKKYLESKLIQFIVSCFKISKVNSKNIFELIPEIDFSKEYTDKDLYQMFNLTQEEINYIESTVKN